MEQESWVESLVVLVLLAALIGGYVWAQAYSDCIATHTLAYCDGE